nr:hypothetical protein [Tanacetum cinerariifolium]
MNTTQAQQKALEDALVALADHLEFGKCNMRFQTDIKPKEATFQVVLDALALTPFYQAFLITTEICPKIPRQELEDLPLEHDILSFIRDLGHFGHIFYLTDADYDTSPKQKPVQATKGTRLKTSAKVAKSDKKKQPAKMSNAKGLDVLSKADYDTSPKQKPVQATKGTRLNTSAKVAKSDKKKQPAKMSNAKGLDVLSKRVSTPPDYELTDEEENKEGDDKDKESEKEKDKEDDLYRDLNINLERSDAEMTDAQANQDTKDTHVTLTTVLPVSDTLVNVPVSVATETPSSITTIPQPHIPNIQTLQQTLDSTTTTTTTNLTMTFLEIPNFASLFQFDQRMKEAVDVAVQVQSNKLREEAQAKNQEFPNQVDSTIKAIINEQAQVSKIMPQIKKYVTESLGAKVLVRSTNQPQTSYAVAASLSKFKLKKILIEKNDDYASNMESSYDVYSRHKIIVVTSLKIMKWFGYSHLEEIIVKRQDDKLYKFREGDFKRFRRQDIKDMLLLLVQDKLTDLNLEERYQMKINLKRPDTYHSNINRMTTYNAYPDVQGIIYEDEMNRKRLMRTDELHKFNDGILNYVRIAVNDIDLGIKMDYLPKRKWSNQDKQRARMMINAIDKKLRDRRLMRSLENFVSGRPYRGDLRLLERTI